jgi:flavin reductase (DIM6/NTAB) family NADH-FMN oxidoreductase RutF
MSWIDQRPDDAMDGAFTAVSPTPFEACDAALFRDAMSRMGAAVHIVTSDGPEGRGGFTATAVCSVSDQPPMLLACLNRKSQSTLMFQRNGVLCVNTLGADEEAIATMFAGRTTNSLDERFAMGDWTTLKTGSPVLTTAVVAFDCRIVEVKVVATHNVLIAGVEAIRLGPSGPALVYHGRAFKRV